MILFSSSFWTGSFAQKKNIYEIRIDTVKFSYKIEGIKKLESNVPQLRGGAYPAALDSINKDLRSYFDASSALPDTTAFIRAMMLEYGVDNRAELEKLLVENPEEQPEQSFHIEFLDNHIINISIFGFLHPQGGRPMFSFDSPCYDLSTGKKLALKDFITLDEKTFLQLIMSKGYMEEQIEDGISRTPVDTNAFAKPFSEIYTKELFSAGITETGCAHFYFSLVDGDLHLRLVSECNGPAWPTAFIFGIAVKNLSPYIVYPSFKNGFGLWGQDIRSLIGQEPVLLDSIVFKEYTVRNGGGYMLPGDNHFPGKRFAISYWNSDDCVFRVFSQWKDSSGHISERRITDILAFKKKDRKPGEMIVETCFLSHFDPEIFALVKDDNGNSENFYKIKCAWRANRLTGKFEKIRKRKIKKCSNDSFGV